MPLLGFPYLFPYILGLTQTRFGKKADASDSASETVKREVAEARGPRRTDACCVSPIFIEYSFRDRARFFTGCICSNLGL